MKNALLTLFAIIKRKLWRLLNELKINFKGKAANPYAGVLEVRCLVKLKLCGLHQQILQRH